MAVPRTEAFFYNALNILTGTDHKELLALKRGSGNWEKAWLTKTGIVKPTFDPDKEWRKLEEKKIELLMADDARYPALLRECAFPPLGLYVLGTLPETFSQSLSIVGTRRATEDGKETARDYAKYLSQKEIPIVSGLAFGIDAAAHNGALDGKGVTVAVLPSGLDNICPRTNYPLAEKILGTGGALVSEYPLGAKVFASLFLGRNRIVAALSKGTLIVECPERSGVTATARFAIEANRDLFVVPGPVRHPNFVGSNALIRAGAELVTRPEDILEAWGLLETVEENNLELAYETPEEKIISKILADSPKPMSIDKIIELSNLRAQTVNQTLSYLIIRGLVKEKGEGYTLN